MAGPGELLLNLFGQSDPRDKLVAGLQAQNQAPSQQSGQPMGAPLPSPQQGPTDTPPPSQQQQPQAYQSTPDLLSLYSQLTQRQQQVEGINRGIGMMFAGFAQPQDRESMVNAMSGMSGAPTSPTEQIGTMAQLQNMQFQRQILTQQYQNAGIYAKQLGIPVEQVIAYIQAGKLPEIMEEVNKQVMLQKSPLYNAQVASTNAETPLKQAQAAAANAEIPLKQAQTTSAQAEAPLKQAQTAEASATAQKTQQDVAARTKLMQNIPALSTATGIDSTVLSSLPPDKLADLASRATELTDTVKNYRQARTELAAQGYDVNTINQLAPPETLIAGASADPNWRSYVTQHAAALKAQQTQAQQQAAARPILPGQPLPSAQPVVDNFPSFEAWKSTNAAASQSVGDVAKQQTDARASLNDQTTAYIKQRDLANKILANPTLDEITGPIAGRMPSAVAPFLSGKSNIGDATDLQQDVTQLADMGFLAGAHNMRQAIGGRVTNVEAQAANEAQTQLHNQAQSPAHYKTSINDVLNESAKSMAIHYLMAGVPVPKNMPEVQDALDAIPPAIKAQYTTGVAQPIPIAPSNSRAAAPKGRAWNPKTGRIEDQ